MRYQQCLFFHCVQRAPFPLFAAERCEECFGVIPLGEHEDLKALAFTERHMPVPRQRKSALIERRP